jgi:hypothetical protein
MKKHPDFFGPDVLRQGQYGPAFLLFSRLSKPYQLAAGSSQQAAKILQAKIYSMPYALCVFQIRNPQSEIPNHLPSNLLAFLLRIFINRFFLSASGTNLA